MASIGAVFGGSFKAPDLLVDDDGIATELYPSTDDESWRVDLKKGEATYGETDVTVLVCSADRENRCMFSR